MLFRSQNSAEVPAEAKAGEEVELIVRAVSAQDIIFVWPSKTVLDRSKRAEERRRKSSPRQGRRDGRGRRRR